MDDVGSREGVGAMNDNRRGCSAYTPDNAPELEIYYAVIPGQPEVEPEIDICDILIHGQEVSGTTYSLLVADRKFLEAEVAGHLRKQAVATL